MLNPELFETAITDFMTYYGRDLTQNTLAYQAWYSYLSQNLKDFELVPALELAIQTFEYMPPPKKLIEAFKGSFEVIALEEWTKLVKWASMGKSEKDLLLSPQGEKALRSLGGFKRICEEDSSQLHNFVSKDFVKRWIGYKNAIDTGAIAAPEPMLNAGANEPQHQKENQPITKEQLADLKAKYADRYPFLNNWNSDSNGDKTIGEDCDF